MPTLWPLYDALKKFPLLIIRGANSDVLSAETFAEMARQHETCETLVVQGQGHAPLLYDDPSIEKIAGFIAKIEADTEQTERQDVTDEMAIAH